MPTLESLTHPAPSFDQPLEMLLACHDRIRRFCDLLDKLSPYIAEHGVDNAVKSTIDSIVRYFDEAGPSHHSDEEDELFPILEARVPTAPPKLEQLRAEHGYLHSCWNAIRDDLLALKNGDISVISRIEIEEFVRQYRLHAAIEEAWLIPTADKVMTAEEKRVAGTHMAAKRTPEL
ncbi:MAG: hemerythrin domain-containing protein [Paludibacterium sp.]|uniref:hemerythrin domain-containing protein n=1 Tax=Paludibacterium sp. TaxID=1917523 RepID=UPI0025D89197|nr:hemerythrin domain-containing protein [Paludibacterium sp.]MBV8046636.1 hemerythrin domain-containing protein [Paludibacterium sp.]MBV8648633.1 hemerythrin domain-containing protein [Paludibacterium sp.]